MKYSELINEFKNEKIGELKYQTIDSYVRRLRSQILPYFEENKLELNNLNDVRKWQNYLLVERGHSIGYINTLRNTLSSFSNFLVKYNYIDTNMISKLPKIKDFNPVEIFDFWEFEEFKLFINEIEDPLWNCFFTVLYYSGCRVGEIRAMTWKQINFKKNQILINRSISKRPNEHGEFIINLPKNNTSRTITMNTELKKSLEKWKDICKNRKTFKDNNLVFMRADGESLSTSTIERKKNYYCSLTGVKQIRIHDFRHSNASLLINMGAPVSVVSERLGHKDKRQTLNIYSHLFPSAEKMVVERIDDLTNIFSNKHEKFAKALLAFLGTVSDMNELNQKETEVMKAINEIAFS